MGKYSIVGQGQIFGIGNYDLYDVQYNTEILLSYLHVIWAHSSPVGYSGILVMER